VKTTVDIPDDVFREAKASAAARGIPLRELVCEGLVKLLREDGKALVGQMKGWPVPPSRISPEEAKKIDDAIEEAFEQIDPDDWA
jgi:hypothetical protein